MSGGDHVAFTLACRIPRPGRHRRLRADSRPSRHPYVRRRCRPTAGSRSPRRAPLPSVRRSDARACRPRSVSRFTRAPTSSVGERRRLERRRDERDREPVANDLGDREARRRRRAIDPFATSISEDASRRLDPHPSRLTFVARSARSCRRRRRGPGRGDPAARSPAVQRQLDVHGRTGAQLAERRAPVTVSCRDSVALNADGSTVSALRQTPATLTEPPISSSPLALGGRDDDAIVGALEDRVPDSR